MNPGKTPTPQKSGTNRDSEALRAERGGFEPPVAHYALRRFSKPVTPLPNLQVSKQDTETVSSVLPSSLPELAEIDPELDRMIEAWPTLPEPIRAAIVALIGTVA